MSVAAPSSPNTGPVSSDTEMSGVSSPSRQILWTSLLAAIPARSGPALEEIDPRNSPTSRATSSPWSASSGPDGWSARTFLHQMLSTSRSDWKPSDTDSLLSRSTLVISQVRVAGGTSLSEAFLSEPPDSPELYLTPRMVWGLARRAVRRRRPLQRVLLRTRCGWRRRTVTCSSRGEGFAFSIPSKPKDSKGSLEDGLLDWLGTSVAAYLATPSASPSPSGSGDD